MAGIGVSVRQAYGPSLAADVFQNQVTITNNSGARVDNLVYRRVMDWDVPPTQFSEYVSHTGVTANLTGAYVSSQWKDVVPFIVMLAILILRPHGLLAKSHVKKV